MNEQHLALEIGLESLDHQLGLLDDLTRVRQSSGIESLGDGLESVGSALKKVWQWILSMLAKIRDGIKNMFTSKAARSKRQADAVKKAQADAKQRAEDAQFDKDHAELVAHLAALSEQAKRVLSNSGKNPVDGLKTVETISKDLRKDATDKVKAFRADMNKVKINADNTVTIEGEVVSARAEPTPAQQKAKDLFKDSDKKMDSFKVTTTMVELDTISTKLSVMAVDRIFEHDVDINELIATIKRLEEVTKRMEQANVEDQKSAATLKNLLRGAHISLEAVMEADKFQEKSVDAYIDFLRNLKKPSAGTESIELDFGNWGILF